MSRLSEDTQIIKNAATTNLSEALRNVTTALIGVGFMFTSSWKLTCKKLSLLSSDSVLIDGISKLTHLLVHHQTMVFTVLALVVVPVISVAVKQFGRYLRELSHKTQAAAALAASIAEESFGAIRTVRSFAKESYMVSQYSKKVDETLKLGLKQAVSA